MARLTSRVGTEVARWRRAACSVALAAALTAGCETSEGVMCCECECCNQTARLDRADQPWPDCDEPCTDVCERDLGCTRPVDSAAECPE